VGPSSTKSTTFSTSTTRVGSSCNPRYPCSPKTFRIRQGPNRGRCR
jgi:hypothetical protein